MPTAPAQPEISDSVIQQLLARPTEQRLREYKYRFSQSVVFGLPVLAVQYWGPKLGPTDAERWGSVIQALLAGWVLYVNLGMLFEGLVLLARRRLTADLIISLLAASLYGVSLASVLHVLVTGRVWYRPLLFSVVVLVLAGWTGARWAKISLALGRVKRL